MGADAEGGASGEAPRWAPIRKEEHQGTSGSSEAIRGHQGASEAIRGHQRSSGAIRSNPRPSGGIRGHPRQSGAAYLDEEAIRGSVP